MPHNRHNALGVTEKAHENKYQAFQLRKKGLTFREIGQELGVNKATAIRYCDAVLAELTKNGIADAERARVEMLARLDDGMKAFWDAAMKGDHKSMTTVLQIMDRQAKLLGLDAPMQIDLTEYVRSYAAREGLPEEALMAEVAKIVEEIGFK